VLRRLSGKAPKRRNIEIFLRFGNTARQDASAHKNVNLFWREPLASDGVRRYQWAVCRSQQPGQPYWMATGNEISRRYL